MATLSVSSITNSGCALTLSGLQTSTSNPAWTQGDRYCHWYVGTSYPTSDEDYLAMTTVKQTQSSTIFTVNNLSANTTYYAKCVVKYGSNITLAEFEVDFKTMGSEYPTVTCYFTDKYIASTEIDGISYEQGSDPYVGYYQNSIRFYASPTDDGKFLYWNCTIGGMQRERIYYNPFTYPDDLGESAQDISLVAVGESGSESTTWTVKSDSKFGLETTSFDVNLNAYELYRCQVTFSSSGTITFEGSGSQHALFLTDNSNWSEYSGTPYNNNGIYKNSGYYTNTALEYDVVAGETYFFWVRYYNPTKYGTISVSSTFTSSGGGEEGGNGQTSDLTDQINSVGSGQHSGRMAFYVRIGVKDINDVIGCRYKVRVYNTSAEAINNKDLYDDTGAIIIKEGVVNASGLDDVVIDYSYGEIEIHNIEVDEYKRYYCRIFIFNDFSHDSSYTGRTVSAPTTAPAQWDWSDIQSGIAVNTISYTRWNDFCNRILEWLTYKKMVNYAPVIDNYGNAASLQGLVVEAKMTADDRTLTANRFNITKMCIYQLNGGTSSSGFTPVEQKKPVLASYFTELAADINKIPA